MRIGNRLKALLKEKKISGAELSRRVSVSRMTVSDWLNGVHNPELSMVEKIAAALNVPVSELLGENIPAKRNPDYVYLPILDVTLSAGHGSENGDFPAVEDCFIMSLVDFKLRFPGTDPANVRIVKVRGDSMVPTFQNKDLVMVEITDCDVRDGLFALTLEGGQCVKRLQLKPGGKVWVVSDNPRYTPTAIDEYTQAKIDGHIIGAIMLRNI